LPAEFGQAGQDIARIAIRCRWAFLAFGDDGIKLPHLQLCLPEIPFPASHSFAQHVFPSFLDEIVHLAIGPEHQAEA